MTDQAQAASKTRDALLSKFPSGSRLKKALAIGKKSGSSSGQVEEHTSSSTQLQVEPEPSEATTTATSSPSPSLEPPLILVNSQSPSIHSLCNDSTSGNTPATLTPQSRKDISRPSTPGSSVSNVSRMHNTSTFEQALKKHAASLPKDHTHAFNSGEDVLQKILQFNQGSSKNRRISSNMSNRVQKVVGFVRQFMGSLQIFIQHSPEISSLVVGGVNCVLSLALNFFEFFDRLTEMMERIGEHLSYLSKYGGEVFQESHDVREALVKAYCDLLEFFVTVREFLLKVGPTTSYRGVFSLFLKSTWEPFEVKFRPIEAKFAHHAHIIVCNANVDQLITFYEDRKKQNIRQEDDTRRNILKWLSEDDYDKTHERHWNKRCEDTGEWLIEDHRFLNWRDQQGSGLLWCYGAPGAGKTVLAYVLPSLRFLPWGYDAHSLVVEHLSRMYELSQHAGVTFLYCNFKESREPTTYIRLAIKQLCRRMEHIPDELVTLHQMHHRNHSQPSLDELQRIFTTIISHFDCVFLVLDALDECTRDQRQVLLTFLKESVNDKQGKQTPTNSKTASPCIITSDAKVLKVFVTSRREEDIERILSNGDFPLIEIKADRVNKDIELYVTKELDRLISTKELILQDPNLRDEIYLALISKADGMFLWVNFQLKALCSEINDHGRRSILKSLPASMEETYERIMNMVHSKGRSQSMLAKRVLMTIAYAQRPLNMEELLFAVAIEKETPDIETLIAMLPTEQVVLTACCNLVIVDLQGFVRFVHFSVQEYLRSNRSDHLSPGIAHAHMAQRCITFILLYFSPRAQQIDPAILTTGSSYTEPAPGFIRYAIDFWHYHCRATPPEALTADDMLALITSFFKFGPILSHTSYYTPSGIIVQHLRNCVFSPVTLAFLFGLSSLAEKFLHTLHPAHYSIGQPYAHYVDEADAMVFAAENKLATKLNAVQLLYNAGYPIDNPQASRSPLAVAFSLETAKFLVEAGADVNACFFREDEEEYGPLPVLQDLIRSDLSYDSNKIAKLLLQNGADVNALGGMYGSAIHAAVKGDVNMALHANVSEYNMPLIEMLLQAGADINLESGEYGYPLQLTQLSPLDDSTSTRLLLEKGADVNAEGGFFGSALQAALHHERYRIADLLLQEGANVNVCIGADGPALQIVARSSKEYTHLLLERGADVNAQCSHSRFGTALASATYCSREDIVQKLLHKGADVNAQCGEYGNALQTAAYGGTTSAMKQLLDAGANVHAQGGIFGNALQAAAVALGHGKTTAEGAAYEKVGLLLNQGVDVNAKGGKYGSALQAAASKRSIKMIQCLLDAGADIHAQGGKFGNVLQAAACHNDSEESIKITQLLLEKGVDVNIRGGVYGSALQAAAHHGTLGLVKFLLGKGADVHARGGKFGSIIQAAGCRHTLGKSRPFWKRDLPETNESTEIIKVLLDAGAKVLNIPDEKYGSLLYAVLERRRDIFPIVPLVKMLLDAGADVNLPGGKFGNALQVAVCCQNTESLELTKLFLEAGVDVNARGGKYGSALRAAARFGRMDIVNLLAEYGACVDQELEKGWRFWMVYNLYKYIFVAILMASTYSELVRVS